MIRLRTQYHNINFTVLEDGRLLMNGNGWIAQPEMLPFGKKEPAA